LEEELAELLGLGEPDVYALFGIHGNHDIVTLLATKKVERGQFIPASRQRFRPNPPVQSGLRR
jgi:hypothetical protein